jgi:hypothetical protein
MWQRWRNLWSNNCEGKMHSIGPSTPELDRFAIDEGLQARSRRGVCDHLQKRIKTVDEVEEINGIFLRHQLPQVPLPINALPAEWLDTLRNSRERLCLHPAIVMSEQGLEGVERCLGQSATETDIVRNAEVLSPFFIDLLAALASRESLTPARDVTEREAAILRLLASRRHLTAHDKEQEENEEEEADEKEQPLFMLQKLAKEHIDPAWHPNVRVDQLSISELHRLLHETFNSLDAEIQKTWVAETTVRWNQMYRTNQERLVFQRLQAHQEIYGEDLASDDSDALDMLSDVEEADDVDSENDQNADDNSVASDGDIPDNFGEISDDESLSEMSSVLTSSDDESSPDLKNSPENIAFLAAKAISDAATAADAAFIVDDPYYVPANDPPFQKEEMYEEDIPVAAGGTSFNANQLRVWSRHSSTKIRNAIEDEYNALPIEQQTGLPFHIPRAEHMFLAPNPDAPPHRLPPTAAQRQVERQRQRERQRAIRDERARMEQSEAVQRGKQRAMIVDLRDVLQAAVKQIQRTNVPKALARAANTFAFDHHFSDTEHKLIADETKSFFNARFSSGPNDIVDFHEIYQEMWQVIGLEVRAAEQQAAAQLITDLDDIVANFTESGVWPNGSPERVARAVFNAEEDRRALGKKRIPVLFHLYRLLGQNYSVERRKKIEDLYAALKSKNLNARAIKAIALESRHLRRLPASEKDSDDDKSNDSDEPSEDEVSPQVFKRLRKAPDSDLDQ